MNWRSYQSGSGGLGLYGVSSVSGQYQNVSAVHGRDEQQARANHAAQRAMFDQRMVNAPFHQAYAYLMRNPQEVAKMAAEVQAIQQSALVASQPEAGPLPDDCQLYRRPKSKRPFPWFGWLLTAACFYGLFLAGQYVWQHFRAIELAKTMVLE